MKQLEVGQVWRGVFGGQVVHVTIDSIEYFSSHDGKSCVIVKIYASLRQPNGGYIDSIEIYSTPEFKALFTEIIKDAEPKTLFSLNMPLRVELNKNNSAQVFVLDSKGVEVCSAYTCEPELREMVRLANSAHVTEQELQQLKAKIAVL